MRFFLLCISFLLVSHITFAQEPFQTLRPRAVQLANSSLLTPLNQIRVDNMRQHLDILSGQAQLQIGGMRGYIRGRNTHEADLRIAFDYLEEYYQDLNITTTRIPYVRAGRTYYNLVADIPGQVTPSRMMLLGAHLDSTAAMNADVETMAPGADDDGTGTVALMEIARVLQGVPLKCSVRIMHFTGEEQGLWGSHAYAQQLRKEKTNVISMIELDMVGYNKSLTNPVELYDSGNSDGSHALAEKIQDIAQRYQLNLQVKDTHVDMGRLGYGSDHMSFIEHDFSAVLITEPMGTNPHYHSTEDKPATLNYQYLVDITRLTLAVTLELAGVDPSFKTQLKPQRLTIKTLPVCPVKTTR